MDDQLRIEVLGHVEQLYNLLVERKKTGQNRLFGKGGSDRLRDLLIRLNDAKDNEDDDDFIAGITVGFPKFLSHAGLLDVDFRDELSSLRAVRACIDGIGTLCCQGGFGKNGVEVTVACQKIVIWLRPLENALIDVGNNMRPQP